jgi:fructokinase
MEAYRIGIDLGGTKTEVIVFAPQGEVLYRHRVATPRDTEDVYAGIVDTIGELVADAQDPLPARSRYTVGVGIPGIINPQTRRVINANTTALIGKPFQEDLQARLGHSVGMANDANCFTLAECRMGAGMGFPMVFGIIMGTGCGGGICIGGKLHSGLHGIAGEWGHFSIDPEGAPCYCGKRGCIETEISGGGVENAHLRTSGQRLDMSSIVAGYRKGDPACVVTMGRFFEAFGRALGGLISILDPDAVILGGGLSNIGELYTIGAERVRHYAFHPRLATPILKNRLGDSAGVFGAAWIGR